MLSFHVFDTAGRLQASTRRTEEAALVVAFLGDGAEVRTGRGRGRVIWREGAESQPAGESYDFAASTMNARATPGAVLELEP